MALFVLLTLLFAWFVNQFLLKFSEDGNNGLRWSGGGGGGSSNGGASGADGNIGSLEDSSPSARAALYATRGRQHHQQFPKL